MASSPDDDRSDLLRERRLELGLPAKAAPLLPARRLLFQGAGMGAIAVLACVGAVVWLQFRQRTLQIQVDSLQPVEVRVAAARNRLRALRAQTKTLNAATQRIAAQLVSVRSGSAFLQQLRQVTPAGVQLASVSVQDKQLNITGFAEGSDAVGSFERINALALNFEMLPEVPDEGARVEKASTDAQGITEFRLKVAIDPSVRATPAALEALGADGLARRYDQLLREGFSL